MTDKQRNFVIAICVGFAAVQTIYFVIEAVDFFWMFPADRFWEYASTGTAHKISFNGLMILVPGAFARYLWLGRAAAAVAPGEGK